MAALADLTRFAYSVVQECGEDDEEFLKKYPDITYVIVSLARLCGGRSIVIELVNGKQNGAFLPDSHG